MTQGRFSRRCSAQLHALVLRVAGDHMAVECLAAELADAFAEP